MVFSLLPNMAFERGAPLSFALYLMRPLMKRASIFAIIIYMIALINIEARASEAPPPPKGFTWLVAKNKVGTFLKPDGWFVKEEGEKN